MINPFWNNHFMDGQLSDIILAYNFSIFFSFQESAIRLWSVWLLRVSSSERNVGCHLPGVNEVLCGVDRLGCACHRHLPI